MRGRASKGLASVPCTSIVLQADTYRSVLSLVLKPKPWLDQLTLQVSVAKLLAVGGDPGLRRINGSLHRRDEPAELFLDLWFPDVVEVGVAQGLLTRKAVGGI